ncbi:hypothetical protein PsexTeo8_56100 [Pseudomonas extremaustralis]|uniref:energy transducer TonB family protein n=1 Tax=Pseudomonas extremaustralis TaxID=359110 RepID=UPI002AA0C68D|nr:energy transducer TonB [Pseudomonas extremaustralis]MDY7069087.1 hypothetical protein [Pseudomonas extremaustralis]
MITMRRKLTRYGTSLAVVLGVHAVAIALMLHMSVARQPQLPPAAMVIDLAPMPAPPPPPAPPKVITPPQPPAPEEELPLPKLAEAPKPTIQVPKPVKPKPKPQPPKPMEKKPEPPKEKPSEDPPSETPPSHAPAEKSAQPAPGPSPQQVAAKASWEGALLAHLQKYKKYPKSALNSGKEGMNRLRFVVDAEGNVLSYELVGRSGNANLDRATLDMIRNAQPLPKPPADMVKSGSIEIVAPFVYNIEKNRR